MCGKLIVSTLITTFYESYSFIKAFHRPIEENYLRYKRNKGSFKFYVSIITIGNGSSLYFTCWQRAYNIPASIKLVPTGKDVELKMEVTSNQLKDNSFIFAKDNISFDPAV